MLGAMRALPPAILFDLDDTLISAYGAPERAWRAVVDEHAHLLAPLDAGEVTRAILAYAREFWSDPDRHRHFRMRLPESRRVVVRGAFDGLAGAQAISEGVVESLADRFNRLREEQMHVFPGACETLDALRQRGIALALVTNGPSELQRAKIARFELEHRFDHIQIEGEHGFGKPEPRAYLHAMQALSKSARDTWMVGDNLEWEVAAPQRLGIYAVWHDADRRGLPPGSPIRPDRTIHAVSELLPDASADPPRD
jgi:putative hydrolase of the HAD superfamily